MKLTTNRAELLCAAKRGENIAPHASALDVLKGLLLETDAANGVLTMTATNLEVALEQKIPCAVPENDAFVLNARLAVAMLEKLSGETVSMEHIPDRHGEAGRGPERDADAGDGGRLLSANRRPAGVCGCRKEKGKEESHEEARQEGGVGRRRVFGNFDDLPVLRRCNPPGSR